MQSAFPALKGAVIDGAAATDVGRLVGGEPRAEGVIGLVVPDTHHAFLRHVAEVQAVGRRDHAAGHGLAGKRDVGAAPGPVAAARGALLELGQPERYAELRRYAACRAEPLLDACR